MLKSRACTIMSVFSYGDKATGTRDSGTRTLHASVVQSCLDDTKNGKGGGGGAVDDDEEFFCCEHVGSLV